MGEDESLRKYFIERIGNNQERHDFIANLQADLCGRIQKHWRSFYY